MLTEDLLDRARGIAPQIIALRRAIHAEPEIGNDTPLTLRKVREALADLPLEWRESTKVTGAIATLKGGTAGPTVLLRGDMDALPVAEETGLEFASTIPGRMHACGHDTHTAMLAGAARLLAARRGEFAGQVEFMFQPGEEGHHGARYMIEEGMLDPPPQAAFALHILPNQKHGLVVCRSGPIMAAADDLVIEVTGRGGHASMPHQTRDPVPVACEIVTAIQTMITRRFDAAEAVVVTITRLDAGSAFNIIPDTVRLCGTIRTLSPERRQQVRDAIDVLARGIAAAHECTAAVTVSDGFPVTINDARAVALVERVAAALPDGVFEHLAHPIMGAEDFSYVLQRAPGAMAFLGVAAANAEWSTCCGIHSSRMIVDESVLPRGSALLAGCALEFLASGFR